MHKTIPKMVTPVKISAIFPIVSSGFTTAGTELTGGVDGEDGGPCSKETIDHCYYVCVNFILSLNAVLLPPL